MFSAKVLQNFKRCGLSGTAIVFQRVKEDDAGGEVTVLVSGSEIQMSRYGIVQICGLTV